MSHSGPPPCSHYYLDSPHALYLVQNMSSWYLYSTISVKALGNRTSGASPNNISPQSSNKTSSCLSSRSLVPRNAVWG